MPLDRALMLLAMSVAENSPDMEKKVGCVISDRDGRIVVSGFNAVPHGVDATPERVCRPEKYQWTEHAERRALNHAARFGIAVDGGSAHVTYFPCHECARSLVDAGIIRVVAPRPDITHATWGKSWLDALAIFREAKIAVVFEGVADVSE